MTIEVVRVYSRDPWAVLAPPEASRRIPDPYGVTTAHIVATALTIGFLLAGMVGETCFLAFAVQRNFAGLAPGGICTAHNARTGACRAWTPYSVAKPLDPPLDFDGE